jgi:hypothetical protein
MSKMSGLLIEIEDLLVQGVEVDKIAEVLSVPVDWVIGLDLELRGLTEHGYEGNYAKPYFD